MCLEKRTAHYPLLQVHALLRAGKVRSTYSALVGAAALEINCDAMIAVVARLTPRDLYKSMTTHADHRVWQDVYRPVTPAVLVYLKLTVLEGLLIVSFKEL